MKNILKKTLSGPRNPLTEEKLSKTQTVYKSNLCRNHHLLTPLNKLSSSGRSQLSTINKQICLNRKVKKEAYLKKKGKIKALSIPAKTRSPARIAFVLAVTDINPMKC